MAATCKACWAPLIWIKSRAGKWMTLNEGLVPYWRDPTGQDSVVKDNGDVIRCRLNGSGKPDGLARTAHFAMCPAAEKFRR